MISDLYILLYTLYPLLKDPNKPSAHIEGANKGDVTYQANKGIGHNSDIVVFGRHYFEEKILYELLVINLVVNSYLSSHV